MIGDQLIPQENQPVTTMAESQAAVRREAVILSGLFLAALLTRLLFTGKILYHWDSINFAFSLNKFDVAAAQPHVPGYILYVFLGRFFNVFFDDAQAAFVAISVISSALAVVMLYLLGRDLYNRKTGFVAALFLASSPLFWFYGEVALPHSLDTFAILLTVWLFFRLIQGKGWFASLPAALLAAAWFGVVGGFRPQTQVFLFPLALYAAWRIGWRRSLPSLVVLGLVDLAWFVPLVTLNGGIAQYFKIMGKFSEAFNSTTSVFAGGGLWGLVRNARKMLMYTLYGWGLALLPFTLGALFFSLRIRSNVRALLKDHRFWVISLWVLPTILYYFFVHMGQQGLVFVYLPALMLLSAAGLFYLAQERLYVRSGLPVQLLPALAGMVILVNSAIFLAAPTYPLGGTSLKLLTRDTLRSHDQTHLALLEGIQENFDSDSSLILASWWRFPQYYLPEYTLLSFELGARWEIDEGQGSVADETYTMANQLGLLPDQDGFLPIDAARLGLQPDDRGYYYLVIMDTSLNEYNQSDERIEWVTLPDGERLAFMRFTPAESFYLSGEAFKVEPAHQLR